MAQSTNSSPKGDSEIDKALLEPLLLPSDPVEEEDLPRARLLGLRRRRRSFLGHSRQPRTKIFKNCIWIFVSIAILVSLGVGIGVAVKRHRRASQVGCLTMYFRHPLTLLCKSIIIHHTTYIVKDA